MSADPSPREVTSKAATESLESDKSMSFKQEPMPGIASTQSRRYKRPSTQGAHDRPIKRRRRWSDIVEGLSLANGVETDPHRIAQRQKQIDFGKNTLAYDKFIAVCPRHTRKCGDPMTPLPQQKCSKRSFNGQVTSWKKKMYAFVAELEDRLLKEQQQRVGTCEDGKSQQALEAGSGSNVNGTFTSNPERTEEASEESRQSLENGPENVASRSDGDKPGPPSVIASDQASTGSTEHPQIDNDESRPCQVDPSNRDMMDFDVFDDYSDMEDIELDDHGNVVSQGPLVTNKPSSSQGDDGSKPDQQPSSSSIFSSF